MRLVVAVKFDDEPVERIQQVLAVRVRAGHIGGRRDARLRQLADVPVLTIRQIPEVHAVGCVETVPRELRWLDSGLQRFIRTNAWL